MKRSWYFSSVLLFSTISLSLIAIGPRTSAAQSSSFDDLDEISPACQQQGRTQSTPYLAASGNASTLSEAEFNDSLDTIINHIVHKRHSPDRSDFKAAHKILRTPGWKTIISTRFKEELTRNRTVRDAVRAVINSNKQIVPEWPPIECNEPQPAPPAPPAPQSPASTGTQANPSGSTQNSAYNPPAPPSSPPPLDGHTHWFFKRPKTYIASALGIITLAIGGYLAYRKLQASKPATRGSKNLKKRLQKV